MSGTPRASGSRLNTTASKVDLPDSPEVPPKTHVTQSESYADSIESVAVRRLLGSFPTTALSARNMVQTEWKETLFATNVVDGKTFVTVPRNVEAFTTNLLFISLLKVFEGLDWIPTLSEKDLPSAVLNTDDGAFFAGYVHSAMQGTCGALNTGTTKFDKGARAYQLYCVDKAYPNRSHLKGGGIDKLMAKLSTMKGFTKEYWGLRGTISSLFKQIPPSKVADLDLASFMKSKTEIMKTIKTKFAFQNGGIFRQEEISYLNARYGTQVNALNDFLVSLSEPTLDLAKNFSERYGRIRNMIQIADNEINPTINSRARICFPNSKKKSDVRFSKLSLTEKINEITDDGRKINFNPQSLPGISWINSEYRGIIGSSAWLSAFYGEEAAELDTTREVIVTWYANFVGSEGTA